MDQVQVRPIEFKNYEQIAQEEGLGNILSSKPLDDDQKVYMAKQFLRRIALREDQVAAKIQSILDSDGLESDLVEYLSTVHEFIKFTSEMISFMEMEMKRINPRSEAPDYEA